MIERAAKHLWILDYFEDIQCDFIAIYRMRWDETRDSPEFFRLATRLPKYQGALRTTLEMEAREEQPESVYSEPHDEFSPGQDIPMSHFLKKGSSNQFEAMNAESAKVYGGQLFEIANG